MSNKEKGEESGKLVAFTSRVVRLTTSSTSGGSDNSEDMSSCNSSCAPKNETKSDLEDEYDLTLDYLIKVKKCSIMLLKKLKEYEKKVLQLQ